MRALIHNNKVVDLQEVEFEVHESMTWVDATDDAELGGSYVDGVFGPADDRTLEYFAEADLIGLRRVRNKKLVETDHWAYQDTPDMTEEQSAYRQALRDITNNYSSIKDVVWPTKPE